MNKNKEVRLTSIVVPTYNEAKNLPTLVKQIHSTVKKNYEIIVVDDNSPDKTYLVAKELSKKYPVRLIHRVHERGLATAVIRGFNESRGDIIGVIDADLSHPPQLIPKLIAAIRSDVDMAVGSRYIKGGGVEYWPKHRQLMSLFATYLAYPLTKVRDPMSGYFFFKKELLKKVDLKPQGYKILLELLVRANVKKFKEVPYMFRNRYVGESKLGTKVTVDYIMHLLKLYKFKLFGK